MNAHDSGRVRRIVAALLLACGLGGCVYAPPYAYDSGYPAYYGYPTYAGPPVALDLGFSFYDGPRHHAYRHHGGWGRRGGWSGGQRGGGWGHGRGRH